MRQPILLYQLLLSLDGMPGLFTRRILANANVSLRGLHLLIYAALGWPDSGRYYFDRAGRQFGLTGTCVDRWLEDDSRFRLRMMLLARGDTMGYEHDYKDSLR